MKLNTKLKKIFLCISIFLLSACSTLNSQSTNDGYVNVDNGSIYYKQIGKGDPIIFIHGGPGLDHNYLTPQLYKFSKNNKIIFYDQRGTGKSLSKNLDENTISIDSFLNDLNKLQNDLGITKAVIVGHSWGGMLGMQYSIKYPEKVSGLVVANSMPATSSGVKDFISNYQSAISKDSKTINQLSSSKSFKEGNPESVSKFYKLIFKNYLYNEKSINKLNLNIDSNTAKNGSKINDIFVKTFWMKDFDISKDLNKINIPTLVIHSSHDIIPEGSSKHIADSIPGAKYKIIENSGHFPYIENENEFFDVMNKFLSGLKR